MQNISRSILYTAYSVPQSLEYSQKSSLRNVCFCARRTPFTQSRFTAGAGAEDLRREAVVLLQLALRVVPEHPLDLPPHIRFAWKAATKRCHTYRLDTTQNPKQRLCYWKCLEHCLQPSCSRLQKCRTAVGCSAVGSAMISSCWSAMACRAWSKWHTSKGRALKPVCGQLRDGYSLLPRSLGACPQLLGIASHRSPLRPVSM